MPRPRPAVHAGPQSYAEAAAGLSLPADLTSEPSACRLRLDAIAVVAAVPRLAGPGECGGEDMVRLTAVTLPNKARISIVPAPELRCEMAEAVAAWLRDEVTPQFPGSALASVANYDSYECRGRNRVRGAKISEHGKGLALDVRAFKLADGTIIDPTDVHVLHDLRDTLRQSACARFTTVLGPGSDGYHESHIHLDIAARRGGYRICQWAVRDPAPVTVAASIPLPLPRPANLGEAVPAHRRGRL
ncbi:MAG: extensin family protein [Pseudolabrys sp.]